MTLGTRLSQVPAEKSSNFAVHELSAQEITQVSTIGVTKTHLTLLVIDNFLHNDLVIFIL